MKPSQISATSSADECVAGVTSDTDMVTENGDFVSVCSAGTVFKGKHVGNAWKVKFGDTFAFVDDSNTLTGSELDSWIKSNEKYCTKYVDVVQECIGISVVYKQPCWKGVGTFKYAGVSGKYYIVITDDNNYMLLDQNKCNLRYEVALTNWDSVTLSNLGGSALQQSIVKYAIQFVGNPYVWGGTDPHTGADCSGFVGYVYKQFGYDLPRCSYEMCKVGKSVDFDDLQPGDLIFYYRGSRIGHVTMYIGGGKCVQAKGKAYGIVVTDWDYSNPAYARRVL